MKICIFGGTFDPVHLGHEEIVESAQKKLQFHELLIVPNDRPPHKKTYAPAFDRYKMALLAFEGKPGVRVAPYEMGGASPGYTVNTIELVRADYPGAQIYFIAGSDSLLEMEKWKGGYSVLDRARFIIVLRNENDLSGISRSVAGKIWILDGRNPVSSTMIREKICNKYDCSPYLKETVYRYIRFNSLYGSTV